MRYLIVIITILSSFKTFGLDYHVETITVNSQYLNEIRVVNIYLPDSLSQNDSVSFLYLLDGESAENRYQKMQEVLSNKQLIGVGIKNTNRNRDLLPTRQPDYFLAFLLEELIPVVENKFYLKERILFGHSFAGGFVINIMLQSPGTFNKYIASSPSPIMKLTESKYYAKLDKELKTPVYFYFSHGSNDTKQIINWGGVLVENIQEIEFKNIEWKNDVLVDTDQDNLDVVALINGLSFH